MSNAFENYIKGATSEISASGPTDEELSEDFLADDGEMEMYGVEKETLFAGDVPLIEKVVGVARVPFSSLTYPDRARRLVFDYVKKRLVATDTHVTFAEDEVYVVSFHFILNGWKAMISTTLPDGMYYEVTYDPVKKQTYVDAYKRWDHVVVVDDEEN